MFWEFNCAKDVQPIYRTIISQETPYKNHDLYLTPEDVAPRQFLGRKFYRTDANGYEEDPNSKKISLEMLPAKTVFKGEISFQCLTLPELSLLAFSLGLDGSILIPMGYAKAYGYGKIIMRLDSVEDLLLRYGGSEAPELTTDGIKGLATEYAMTNSDDILEAIYTLRSIIGKDTSEKDGVIDGTV